MPTPQTPERKDTKETTTTQRKDDDADTINLEAAYAEQCLEDEKEYWESVYGDPDAEDLPTRGGHITRDTKPKPSPKPAPVNNPKPKSPKQPR